MTTAMYIVGAALIAFAVIRHERRILWRNRNSSWMLSEAQKKARATKGTGMNEYGGTRLP